MAAVRPDHPTTTDECQEAAGGGRNALMYASMHGHVEIVKKLLEAGAKIDDVDNEGFTALMYAIMANHTDVADALVDAGADVNIKCKYEINALMFAEAIKNDYLVKKLKKLVSVE